MLEAMFVAVVMVGFAAARTIISFFMILTMIL
jgi:hypothetical protein